MITAILLGTLYVPQSRNWLLKNISEIALSTEFFKVKIESIDSQSDGTNIRKIHLKKNGEIIATLDTINIKYNLWQIISKQLLDIELKLEDEAKIFGISHKIKSKIHLFSRFPDKKEIRISIDEISSPLFEKIGMGSLKGNCTAKGNKDSLKIDQCKISDPESSFVINLSGGFDAESIFDIAADGEVKAFSDDIHQTLYKVIPENEVVEYLNETMSKAKLSNLKWKVNLPKEYFKDYKMKPEYLTGQMNIDSLEYKYDEDFPPLKNMKAMMKLSGNVINFEKLEATTSSTKLSGGLVSIDWGIEGDPDVVIKNVKSEGPAKDLTDFIPKEGIKELQDTGIDLTKFTGTATGDINLIIPTSVKPNTYDITANISKAGLSIFKNNIKLRGAKLQGKFDGDNVIITGKGKVNGFTSDLDFRSDLTKKGEFDNQLKLRATLLKIHYGNTLPVIAIDSGISYLDFEYRDKSGKKNINAKSDLYSLEFSVDKLGIHKRPNDTAMLEINGESGQGTFPLKIKLLGKKLDIQAIATLSDELHTIDFKKIKNHDTNIKASIELGKGHMKSMVFGDFIDLSRSNMMQFLAKDASDFGSDIKVKFKEAKLKDGIYLENFFLDVECDIASCSKGVMRADIGEKQLTMNLTPHKDFEQWAIESGDAGATLQGFGVMKNVRSGTLSMNVKTNIKKAEIGKVIPIAEGEFKMENFATTKNKFLGRLVSFTSLPGLLTAITTGDISFKLLEGKFDFKDDIINIYDGSANGPFLDLTIKGQIDTKSKKGSIKGRVIPSLYGVNKLINKVPVIGNLFGGRKSKGVVQAPYKIEYEY